MARRLLLSMVAALGLLTTWAPAADKGGGKAGGKGGSHGGHAHAAGHAAAAKHSPAHKHADGTKHAAVTKHAPGVHKTPAGSNPAHKVKPALKGKEVARHPVGWVRSYWGDPGAEERRRRFSTRFAELWEKAYTKALAQPVAAGDKPSPEKALPKK